MQREEKKRRGHNIVRVVVSFSLASLLFSLLLAGCGFHLRGAEGVTISNALPRLRVVVQDTKVLNDPLLIETRSALKIDPNVVLTDDADAPTLILFDERSDTQLLSVSSTGRVSGYTLRYEVSYRLTGAGGRELLAPHTVRLLRDYTYDPLNVLAKEQEEVQLRRTLQRDAVQQIVRRLARYAEPKEIAPPKE